MTTNQIQKMFNIIERYDNLLVYSSGGAHTILDCNKNWQVLLEERAFLKNMIDILAVDQEEKVKETLAKKPVMFEYPDLIKAHIKESLKS
jgi:hypothetical protein